MGGITVNGVGSHDPQSPVWTWLFILVLVLVGLGIVAGMFFFRVETDAEGVKMFNVLNQPTFAAAWGEVTRYERVESPGGSLRYWKISTDKSSTQIPDNLDTYPAIQRALLTRIPASAIPSAYMYGASDAPSPVEDLDLPMSGAANRNLMSFSIFWYGLLAVFAGVALFAGGGPGTGSIDTVGRLVFIAVPLVFAVTTYPFYAAAWKVQRRGRITADRFGIAVYDGEFNHEIAWKELKMLEIRWVHWSNRGYAEEMVLVGARDGAAIRATIDAYEQVKAFAIAHAPAGSLVVL